MSFAQLEETLTREAGRQIEEIREKIRNDLEREEQRLIDKAKRAEGAIIEQAKESAEQKAKRLHQTAQLEARAEVLRAKQYEIEKTYEEAVGKILAWDTTKSENLLNKLLTLVPRENGVLVAGNAHKQLLEKLTGGKRAVADEAIPNDGGFVFRGKDVEYRLTVRQLVAREMASHRTELAKALFD